jgi:uncharacterized protein (DUF927 family)
MSSTVVVEWTQAIDIAGRGICEEKRDHFLLRVTSPNGTAREEILSVRDYKAKRSETESILNLPIVTAKASSEFASRVQASQAMQDTFDVATQCGWFKKAAFVFPNGEVAGERRNPLRKIRACLPLGVRQFAHAYKKKGELAKWQDICKLAEGNSRLMMSIALAFAGPIGELVGGEPPMIQLVGSPESGKSSIAIAAGSVWGEFDDKKLNYFIETWNNTANNLEDVAAAHCGTFLVLDETALADESKNDNPYPFIKKTVIRLNKGIEKGRKNQSERRKWWMGVLSTSNLSLDEMAIASTKSICPDQIKGRLVDVPMPGLGDGAFEELYEFKDEGEFSTELIKIAREHYGIAATIFVEGLAVWSKTDDLGKFLDRRREDFRAHAKKKINSGGRQSRRITESFATIYAAGRAAMELEILPWTRWDLADALVACEQAHFDATEKSDELNLDKESKKVWNEVKEFVRNYKSSFRDLREGLPEEDPDMDLFNSEVMDRNEEAAKLVCINQPRRGEVEYLFLNLDQICRAPEKVWNKVFLGLRETGDLVTGATRFQMKRQLRKRRIDDEGDIRVNVYAIRASAFASKPVRPDPRRAQQSGHALNPNRDSDAPIPVATTGNVSRASATHSTGLRDRGAQRASRARADEKTQKLRESERVRSARPTESAARSSPIESSAGLQRPRRDRGEAARRISVVDELDDLARSSRSGDSRRLTRRAEPRGRAAGHIEKHPTTTRLRAERSHATREMDTRDAASRSADWPAERLVREAHVRLRAKTSSATPTRSKRLDPAGRPRSKRVGLKVRLSGEMRSSRKEKGWIRSAAKATETRRLSRTRPLAKRPRVKRSIPANKAKALLKGKMRKSGAPRSVRVTPRAAPRSSRAKDALKVRRQSASSGANAKNAHKPPERKRVKSSRGAKAPVRGGPKKATRARERSGRSTRSGSTAKIRKRPLQRRLNVPKRVKASPSAAKSINQRIRLSKRAPSKPSVTSKLVKKSGGIKRQNATLKKKAQLKRVRHSRERTASAKRFRRNAAGKSRDRK